MKRLQLAAGLALACTAAALAQGHPSSDSQQPPASFEASTGRPFAALMHEAMHIMDEGMQRAPMNGDAEHDFVVMMIPHHQGAVDMAKAVLLNTQDPAMRNLALGIVTEQQYEIERMHAWLEQHRKGQS